MSDEFDAAAAGARNARHMAGDAVKSYLDDIIQGWELTTDGIDISKEAFLARGR